jgi:hypothetical protein
VDLGAWLCFEDESGQGLRPPKGRTWGRRGATPVVRVTAQGNPRVSIAALIAARPGTAGRARLIYRTHLNRGSGKHRRMGFTETGYARLLDAAHQQLHGPIVLVWDNLPTHTSRAMRQLIAARSWLTVYQLPAYAPELNPVEAVWSNLKRSLANPHQAGHRSAGRADQDPAQTDAVPARPHRRLPRQDPARSHTPVTFTIEDL